MTSPAVAAEDLRKTNPGGVEALAGIDLAVTEGTIAGFLGPNGAGKSTTIRILTTLLKPTGGRAQVAGLDVVTQADRVRRVIGVALQEAGLDAFATGRELLMLHARLHGMRGNDARRRTDEMLGLVGLTGAAGRRIGTYSGGMRRRLDLGAALVHSPRILFLDEPTAGLDPASRQGVWDEVRRLNREEGITVFLTTQYLEEADRLAQRVAIVDRGRIVAEGTPASLKASIGSDVLSVSVPPARLDQARGLLSGLDEILEVRADGDVLTLFLSDGTGSVPRVIRRLDQAGVDVSSVRLTSPTLDEVLLRLTGSRLEGSEAT